jgi:hypothetical protein
MVAEAASGKSKHLAEARAAAKSKKEEMLRGKKDVEKTDQIDVPLPTESKAGSSRS